MNARLWVFAHNNDYVDSKMPATVVALLDANVLPKVMFSIPRIVHVLRLALAQMLRVC